MPYDFLVNTNKCYLFLIKKFIYIIKNKKTITLKNQNDKMKTYLPRFYTDIMGAINWNWEGKYIQSFIRGCSKPYSGAYSFVMYKYRPVKIKIFNAKFKSLKINYHPFLNGKIFYQDKNILKVTVQNGILIIDIKYIEFEDKNQKFSRFEGKTFFNNTENLLTSQSHQPNVFNYNK